MRPPSRETHSPAGGRGFAVKHASGQAQRDANLVAVQTSTPPSVDALLGRLDRVRRSGDGWTAMCPAHEDRSASLSVGIGRDGRILAHCFAGCSVGDVLGAIGLEVGDLFQCRLADATPEARKELQALALRAQLRAAANVIEHEASVVLIAAGDLERGQVLADADHARLALASDRIRAARVALGGAR